MGEKEFRRAFGLEPNYRRKKEFQRKIIDLNSYYRKLDVPEKSLQELRLRIKIDEDWDGDRKLFAKKYIPLLAADEEALHDYKFSLLIQEKCRLLNFKNFKPFEHFNSKWYEPLLIESEAKRYQLPNKLKEIREWKEIPYEELQAILDLSKENIAAIEEGKEDPELTTLCALSRCMGVYSEVIFPQI